MSGVDPASAYRLLARGVHLGEIQRFADAGVCVDREADTIPAPPPEEDGTVDPDKVPTVRCPRGTPDYTEALDLRDRTGDYWDGVAKLVES